MIMAEMKMNQNRNWLLRMADEEANCEVSEGGPAQKAGLLKRSGLNESARLSLAKFLELSRRRMNESLESLAVKAGVDLAELTSLERGKSLVPNPKKLEKLAAALHVDVQPLLELAGLVTTTDQAGQNCRTVLRSSAIREAAGARRRASAWVVQGASFLASLEIRGGLKACR
jgi:transcriptional regulator with XRE-family HTH domain